MECAIICMCYGQTGRMEDYTADGDLFCIKGGVRQGCALDPRLYCVCFGNSVWMLASESWHCWCGFLFDDIVLFAKTFEETFFVGRTCHMLYQNGATTERGKTKILTSQ